MAFAPNYFQQQTLNFGAQALVSPQRIQSQQYVLQSPQRQFLQPQNIASTIPFQNQLYPQPFYVQGPQVYGYPQARYTAPQPVVKKQSASSQPSQKTVENNHSEMLKTLTKENQELKERLQALEDECQRLRQEQADLQEIVNNYQPQ